jgi:hypothetical protein
MSVVEYILATHYRNVQHTKWWTPALTKCATHPAHDKILVENCDTELLPRVDPQARGFICWGCHFEGSQIGGYGGGLCDELMRELMVKDSKS